jgi:hypothetical protein
MKQEDKKLLLQDLCGRLPYGVKCKYYDVCEGEYDSGIIIGLDRDHYIHVNGICIYVEEIKPYLYPLSSITKEQSIELFNLFGIDLVDPIGTNYIKINECTGITFFLDKGFDIETHLDKLLDWLHKNHFDYRGLIEKGLAIDATGLNIY